MRRLLARIARFASTLLFRRVEVAGVDRCPPARRAVAPVLLAAALGRLPRFIAKWGLRRIPIGGLVLRAAGVVFVHRKVDGGGGDSNQDAVVDWHRALATR